MPGPPAYAAACLSRRCGHPGEAHRATPELAGPREIVVFCTACHRHEVQRARRWPGRWSRAVARPPPQWGRAT
ncbi:MAG TPA: hypothetical protein VMG14_06555 [Thermoplasmata archaeon]|nr:hypothetical protein [Thermoplasmata archaeon]